jgi:hypothetical protein
MLIDDLCARLIASAKAVGWTTSEEPNFVSQRFRGRDEEAQVQLPIGARGLRLGRYPVVVGAIDVKDSDGMLSQLRSAHNQMVLARSFMRADEIIDAHIFFVTEVPSPDADWAQLVDLVERDESVCRKIVWVPHITDLNASYDAFLDRTFLAQPWISTDEQNSAPLDQNERLVENILQKNGLSAAAAAKWVQLADLGLDDHDELIDQLVAAMETPK